jgi:hypothetical protein
LFDKYYSEGEWAVPSMSPSSLDIISISFLRFRDLTTGVVAFNFADALQQKAGALSLEAQAKLDKKAADLEAKADVKAEADLKKKKVCSLATWVSESDIKLIYLWARPPRQVANPPTQRLPLRGINQYTLRVPPFAYCKLTDHYYRSQSNESNVINASMSPLSMVWKPSVSMPLFTLNTFSCGGYYLVFDVPSTRQSETSLGFNFTDPASFTPDVDLKKAAKLFAQKFATGSSVTKNPQGQDEIVVQGDVTDDIVEMIENQVGVLKGVPEDNVVCIEEKKKKSAE